MIITYPDEITREAIISSIVHILNMGNRMVSYIPEIKIQHSDKLSIILEQGEDFNLLFHPDTLKELILEKMKF